MMFKPAKSWVSPGLFDTDQGRGFPLAPLEPHAYALIMIDSPWEFINYSDKGLGKSAQQYYDCMSINDIAALPVRDLAADHCLIWMWCTTPMLNQQIRILEDAWGFAYVTEGIWYKRTVNDKPAFGHGYVLRNAHEPFLIGKIGSPRVYAKDIRSVFEAPLREHSRKPDEAYALARRMVPYGRAADVFSRTTRTGWEAFGNETGKFDGAFRI